MENLPDTRSQRQAGVATSHRMLIVQDPNYSGPEQTLIKREANNDSSMRVSVNEIS